MNDTRRSRRAAEGFARRLNSKRPVYRVVERQIAAAPGQIWLDLSTPGRMLTINDIGPDGKAICTSYNSHAIGLGSRKVKITKIRADRFRAEYRAVPDRSKAEGSRMIWTGFIRLELVDAQAH